MFLFNNVFCSNYVFCSNVFEGEKGDKGLIGAKGPEGTIGSQVISKLFQTQTSKSQRDFIWHS
jgi:hypothetical protein